MLAAIAVLFPTGANAQLSKNPDKFLGNITTRYQVDYGNESYYTLWNQITPENETKWGSVEGSRRGSFSWNDAAYNYAKSHNFPFKFHCLIWGAQYPEWINSLSTAEQYKAIVEWFDAVKQHYPTLDMIDVVNEAVPGHQPAPYKNALGGDGITGYDWIIKAFEMAHERWPDAILIYNDYNTFQWQTDEFINLVKTVRDAGAPIDAYGCQSHDLTDMSFSDFKTVMTKIQNALKMPMYSSEYDIGTTDDQKQYKQYKDQIAYMWEQDYCAGITLWGYIYGTTWTTDGNSGIIRDGKDRPAMTWLREYMKSDAAKTAKSPFPGMKKEASVYVKSSSLIVEKGKKNPISVEARFRTKTIDHVELYVDGSLYYSKTQAPFDTTYTPSKAKKYTVKVVAYATDGSKYERSAWFEAKNPRKSYNGTKYLPGTFQYEDYDEGGESYTYHDSDTNNKGDGYYRTGDGVDVINSQYGRAVGYTETGEWFDYTVNVKEDGIYEFETYVSAATAGTGFAIDAVDSEGISTRIGTVTVPKTGNNTYKKISGRLTAPLKAGKQILRVTITSGGCDLDKITFKKISVNNNIRIGLSATPSTGSVGDPITIIANVTPDTCSIDKVEFYQNGEKIETLTEAPYQYVFTPSSKGTYTYSAYATDAAGSKSKIASISISVTNKRSPYSGSAIPVPGTIQAEHFDKGGENISYHDSDSQIEGDGMKRSDNEGVDIVAGNGGNAIGYTASGEWLYYTINVANPGTFKCTATVSSGVTGSGFTVNIIRNGSTVSTATISVPQTGSNDWSTYKTVAARFSKDLEAGEQTLQIKITGANCNIDKLLIECMKDTSPVDGIRSDESEDTYYNLGGMKVSPTYRGITIKNGKKVLYLE